VNIIARSEVCVAQRLEARKKMSLFEKGNPKAAVAQKVRATN
jgi:hypothetical protein